MKKINIIPHILPVIMLICIYGFVLVPPSVAEDFVFIVNKSLAENALPKEDIKNIFLGKKKKWEDNSDIFIVLNKNETVHRELLKKYVRRSPAQFRNVWKKLVFTGEAKFPRSFSSDDVIIDYVSHKKGSIGYISRGRADGNVKIIVTE